MLYEPKMAMLTTKEDLTPFTLSQIFSNYFDAIENNDQCAVDHVKVRVNVEKILSIHPIQAGQISQVMEVNMETTTTRILHNQETNSQTSFSEREPMSIIAKFQQSEDTSSTLSQFSLVERNFFEKYHADVSQSIPFSIPKVFYASDNCFLLERVQNIKQYSLLEKCPIEHIDTIIQSLATMHANCWIAGHDRRSHEENNNTGHDQYLSLSSNPGIGSSLDGIKKEQLFPNSWNDFVQYNVTNNSTLTTDERTCLGLICQEMSNKKLRQIHDYVNHPSNNTTLIHGDFHLANILIQNNEEKLADDTEKKNIGKKSTSTVTVTDIQNEYEYWLIDWATCGKGNPIKDFIFFILLSTEATEDNDEVMRLLKLYYTSLVSSSQRVISKEYTWEKCVESYQYGIVNQFLILVAFDHFSRDMASGNEELTTHFLNVNRRCIRTMLSPTVNVQQLMMQISNKSAEDLKEEKDAIRNGTLKVSL